MLFRLLRSPRLKTGFTALSLLVMLFALLRCSASSAQAARSALLLCGNTLIPSLFPFFVLSNLTVELGLAAQMGRGLERIMRPLFRVSGPGAAALALGLVGGYPVGARTAVALYRRGQCTRGETQRLLAFCNNSGPAFIFGVVGLGLFSDLTLGVFLYLIHVLSSLLVGLLFRFYPDPPPSPSSSQVPSPAPLSRSTTDATAIDSSPSSPPKLTPSSASFSRHTSRAYSPPPVSAPPPQAVRSFVPPSPPRKLSSAFPSAVVSAASSVLNICSFVVFFSVFVRILYFIPPFSSFPSLFRSLLSGCLELTGGITSLTSGALSTRLSLAAFLLGWAGLSVHCQVLSFLAESDLSPRTYFLGKFLHGTFSAAFVYLFTRFFPLEEPVSLWLTPPLSAVTRLNFPTSFLLPFLLSCAIFLIFLFFALWAGKSTKSVVK